MRDYTFRIYAGNVTSGMCEVCISTYTFLTPLCDPKTL